MAAPAPAELLASAEAQFARRPDMNSVLEASLLFAQAVAAAPTHPEPLYRSAIATLWLLEHTEDAAPRGRLAQDVVGMGQRCLELRRDEAWCHYALALGLEAQARERPASAAGGLPLMLQALDETARLSPEIDYAGPARHKALVLLRSPTPPAGLGDPEAAVPLAQYAVDRFPEYVPNQLVLVEALVDTGVRVEAETLAWRALEAARKRHAAADPDAEEWMKQAQGILDGLMDKPAEE